MSRFSTLLMSFRASSNGHALLTFATSISSGLRCSSGFSILRHEINFHLNELVRMQIVHFKKFASQINQNDLYSNTDSELYKFDRV